jgi:hypothetical protein
MKEVHTCVRGGTYTRVYLSVPDHTHTEGHAQPRTACPSPPPPTPPTLAHFPDLPSSTPSPWETSPPPPLRLSTLAACPASPFNHHWWRGLGAALACCRRLRAACHTISATAATSRAPPAMPTICAQRHQCAVKTGEQWHWCYRGVWDTLWPVSKHVTKRAYRL